jgi:L-alanine-DL-glutamate epimerase-like enolase superfamily enzyme
MALKWTAEKLHLDLNYSWAIARNISDFKENLIIRCSDGKAEGIGECAPNIRYGETPELAWRQFREVHKDIRPMDSELFHHQFALKNICNALRFGIESAYVSYCAAKSGVSINKLLRLPEPTPRFTSFSIPMMNPSEIEEFGKRQDLSRFKYLKIKIRNEEGLDTIREVNRLYNVPLMIDANEGWTDPDRLLEFMEKLDRKRILFVEQPFPAARTDEYIYLKSQSPFEIWADESVTDHADFSKLTDQFHGVNVKLMKAGSYFTGIDLLTQARAHRMKTMIGCMVETTIGIASGLRLESLADYIDLDGFLVMKDEPFKEVKLNSEGELVLMN